MSFPAEQIYVIPNGVDWAYFAFPQREAARAELQVPEKAVVLVYSGRVVPDKGLMALVDALQILVEKCQQDILLLVAGSAGLGHPYRDQTELTAPCPPRFNMSSRSKIVVRDYRYASWVIYPAVSFVAFIMLAISFVCPSVLQNLSG